MNGSGIYSRRFRQMRRQSGQVVCKTCFSWMIFIRPEARRKRVPGRFCLRGLKKSVFLPFVLDKDAKVDMIEKIGRGKPYKWKYSGISG